VTNGKKTVNVCEGEGARRKQRPHREFRII
jgi:hypothetical protein